MVVMGLMVVLSVCRFFNRSRQMSSSRSLGHFSPERKDGQIVFETPITVTSSRQWRRLLLTLKSTAADQINKSPRYFLEKVALLVGTPYTLTLSDAEHRVLHAETGTLEPLIASVLICIAVRWS